MTETSVWKVWNFFLFLFLFVPYVQKDLPILYSKLQYKMVKTSDTDSIFLASFVAMNLAKMWLNFHILSMFIKGKPQKIVPPLVVRPLRPYHPPEFYEPKKFFFHSGPAFTLLSLLMFGPLVEELFFAAYLINILC